MHVGLACRVRKPSLNTSEFDPLPSEKTGCLGHAFLIVEVDLCDGCVCIRKTVRK